MINLPTDYDSARPYDGNSAPLLPLGGHVCRIIAARMEKTRNGGDMLVCDFDVIENTDFNNYYKRRYDNAVKYRPSAKWPGVFRTNLLNKEGKCSGYFKGLITALEESNSGFNFKATGGNEAALRGLYVGLVFGEREFRTQDTGEIKTVIEPFYAVSVAKVNEGVAIPAKKVLQENNAAQTFQEVDPGDDLPF